MSTTEYKSIEVDGRTIIMDEAQAFSILHAMRREFGWAGTMFSAEVEQPEEDN